ncbi:HlyD family secretion protein [Alicyclobacillus sendaiensis]|uniref:HlyD family secretion protein n=1 Tax=Alicyclobacillus sendaiensis TaxID=192387 RepID=UPI0026F4272C|nr:efflux RND transporter periplasmic adaptor subunit [Alicyclobacillus sendaiensis]
MKPAVKRSLQVGLGVVIAAALAGGGYYWYESSQYLTTDDAYVDGFQYVIEAPASGKVVNWEGYVGATLTPGAVIGDIEEQSGNAMSDVPVESPGNVSIVQRDVADGEEVVAGTPMAYAYDLHNLYVTANVKETLIREVHVGQKVKIDIDAYPGQTFEGVVARIGLSTASALSEIPSTSDNANFTKVTQVIPVTIDFTTYPVEPIVPGMDVTVHIVKNS